VIPEAFTVIRAPMLTPDNNAALQGQERAASDQRDSNVVFPRIHTPVGELLTRVALGLDISSDEQSALLEAMIGRTPSAQAWRTEAFNTLEELLTHNLRGSGDRSLEATQERTGLLELTATLVGESTIYDMAPDQHERLILLTIRELARLTCVESWESGHTEQLEGNLEIMGELLSSGEEPRLLSPDLRERLVLSVGRFLAKVESHLFRGVQSLELAGALGALYRVTGLLRQPLFADKLEELCCTTLRVCEYLTPDGFGENWREADDDQQPHLDEGEERYAGGVLEDESEEFQEDHQDEVDLESEDLEQYHQNLAAELFYDLLITFKLSGGAGREDFWSTTVESISHTTKTLGAALLGLSTCSQDCIRRSISSILQDATTEPTALLHVVNLMCASELYQDHALVPCDTLIQSMARDMFSRDDRRALRVAEVAMFRELGDLIDDHELAHQKLSMLR
jgi:hypothetical protein